MSVLSQQVHGASVIGSIETKISYTSGSQTTTFITRQNTLGNALAVQGIMLAKNDVTEPSLTTSLIGDNVKASLVPAQPVLINDNGQSWVGKSAYTSTPQILGQLGVAVDKVDRVTTELILDPVTDNMAGQKITIVRAPVYTVSVDSKQVVVHSWSQTVAQVLADGGVSLNQNDLADPARDAVAPASGQIMVTRVNYADVQENEAVDYQTVNQNDYDLYQGKTEVIQAGIEGSKINSVHIVYYNGAEVSRTITGTVVNVQVQKKIVGIGVKPYSHQDLWNIMVSAQAEYGVDPSAMFNVMTCESGGNVNSGAGSSHQGLFQWDSSFYSWAAKAGYPNASILDPTAQIYATAMRVSQNGWSAWSCKP